MPSSLSVANRWPDSPKPADESVRAFVAVEQDVLQAREGRVREVQIEDRALGGRDVVVVVAWAVHAELLALRRRHHVVGERDEEVRVLLSDFFPDHGISAFARRSRKAAWSRWMTSSALSIANIWALSISHDAHFGTTPAGKGAAQAWMRFRDFV